MADRNRISSFSSDEEASPISQRRQLKQQTTSRSSKTSSRSKASATSRDVMGEQIDVTQLSDEVLSADLRRMGVNVGPIVETTRRTYERKYLKLLYGGANGDQSLQAEENDYDDEDDAEEEAEEEPEEVQEAPSRNFRRRTVDGVGDSPKRVAVATSMPRLTRRSLASMGHSLQIQEATSWSGAKTTSTTYKKRTYATDSSSGATYRPVEKTSRSWATLTTPSTPARTVATQQPRASWLSPWVQLLILVVVAALVFLVIQNMESNPSTSIPKLTV
ncbi:PREDICTED: lamina-associated polypeptide 2, isoforms beta/delta/epsilon/gamma-like isoform X2 [Priapulus caudatus]|uniref:Lamina-associated polypeptide 2, isoforms beta/delta/epsilon/gamma-like isoform X2 n=1 Tax=Priapulus caudatus TaxID=37621 RepID=A0ABM1DYH4_PRICU|nr:PREDICTED: lamina-associated polypeptide 2, isoforms beta/delta/epsilon/gamma-like isoform X2 [Priapulus caudatus]